MRSRVPQEAFHAWFEPARSVRYAEGKVTIEVPGQIFVEEYEANFRQAFAQSLLEVYGPGTRAEFTYMMVAHDSDSSVTIEGSAASPSVAVQKPAAKPNGGVEYAEVDPQLSSVYNFENYCVGESNRLPYSIAENVGSNPHSTVFSPFFLHGGTGVGKTHLIQAIGIRVKERFPKARVLYITSRIFENQYGTAVREKRVNDFINFYQSIDALLIDDVQELAGKTGTQNAFYPIFNFLHQKGKLLVMTSDRPPVELEGMMDRLLSRFKWGVIEVLPAPDLELRKQILRRKSAKNGLALPEAVIDVIASHVTDSVRELEGVVMSLITRATLLGQEITPDLAKVVMQSAVKLRGRKINFDMIVEACAAAYSVDPDVIFSRSRMRVIGDARQMIMYMASRHTSLSSPAIGQRLGRTHVTVLHGIRVVADRIATDAATSQLAQEIERNLLNND